MSQPSYPFDFSHLSPAERILLAQELWESVYHHAAEIPLTEAERQELQRRWADYETGATTAFTWPEVKQRLLDK